MTTFVRNFADYLRPYIADFCPVLYTPPGELTESPRIALLKLDSATELIERNQTMELSLVFSAVFNLSEKGKFDPTDICRTESGLYAALFTALDNLVQYRPLPGQPDTTPIILASSLSPPQSLAENYSHLLSFTISLTVQF